MFFKVLGCWHTCGNPHRSHGVWRSAFKSQDFYLWRKSDLRLLLPKTSTFGRRCINDKLSKSDSLRKWMLRPLKKRYQIFCWNRIMKNMYDLEGHLIRRKILKVHKWLAFFKFLHAESENKGYNFCKTSFWTNTKSKITAKILHSFSAFECIRSQKNSEDFQLSLQFQKIMSELLNNLWAFERIKTQL